MRELAPLCDRFLNHFKLTFFIAQVCGLSDPVRTQRPCANLATLCELSDPCAISATLCELSDPVRTQRPCANSATPVRKSNLIFWLCFSSAHPLRDLSDMCDTDCNSHECHECFQRTTPLCDTFAVCDTEQDHGLFTGITCNRTVLKRIYKRFIPKYIASKQADRTRKQTETPHNAQHSR